jgi:hypothetical protein
VEKSSPIHTETVLSAKKKMPCGTVKRFAAILERVEAVSPTVVSLISSPLHW